MANLDESLSMVAAGREDDEGLFSRDINGELVRVDAPTEADYETRITLSIDGRKVTVPLAEPLRDAQGNLVLDLLGRTTPRYTTVFDATLKLYAEFKEKRAQQGDVEATIGPGGMPLAGWEKFPIPVLCHQTHMKPVAVCRVCMVQVYGVRNGRRSAERRLQASCHVHVKKDMEVFTISAPGPDGDKVRKNVKVVAELLSSEHLRPAPATTGKIAELNEFNELKALVERTHANAERFKNDIVSIKPPTERQRSVDESSSVFVVDRSACILCDRCVRACGEVKGNHIIGRAGKGQTARIAFDLDENMGDSGCVQCGECMVSCPTTAITFKPVAKVKPARGAHDVEVLPATTLANDPLLSGVPPKFLLWQEGLVVKRQLRAGEYLCRDGDPGNTAFMIRRGKFEVLAWSKAEKPKKQQSGLMQMMFGPPKVQRQLVSRFEVGPQDVIVGEMACLSGTPRTADLKAIEDSEVWELRRNVLDRVMRSPTQRARFENLYRKRALQDVLRSAEVFQDLPHDEYQKVVEYLRPKLSFVRVSPGQVIFEQGARADMMYLVRLGHIQITISQPNTQGAVIFRGPNSILGEVGLMALSPKDAGRSVDEVDQRLEAALKRAGPEDIQSAVGTGARTATCSALDHVELAQIRREDFLEMIRDFGTLRRKLVERSLKMMRSPQGLVQDAVVGDAYRQYVEQGLYQGQSLLVLDLENCTRCDLCTQACTAQHGTESHGVPFTRLIREGLRFGDNLVATSCRSCVDAYCMIGCPVDSIHRGKHHQIVIEDHCIGCGLCASNCPYGNIFMIRPQDHKTGARIAQPKAAACDLCDPEGLLDEPRPRCVSACPHNAAIRMTGPELLKKVTGIDPKES